MFNNVIDGLQLSSLCKDVCLESLVVQTTHKMVFNVDAGYVCFGSWTTKLTVHSEGTYSHEEVLKRLTLTLHEITKVHSMKCWIHTFCNYFLNNFKHGRLIHVKECGVRVNKTVLHCTITGIVQMRSNLRGKKACHLLVHFPVNDKFTKLWVCHVGNDGRHLD